MYFPALDKADSLSFPPDLELTLPNLIEFVRHAAGPAANIGACSRTCISSNLRTTASALVRLHSEISQSLRAISLLQSKLRALFFADPPSQDPVHHFSEFVSTADEVSRLISPSTVSSDNTKDHLDAVTVEASSDTTVPVQNDDETLESDDLCDELCSNMQSRHTARTSCSVERLLRLRDELALLRRHLHRAHVKRFQLRHLYTHVLLPAVVHGLWQLDRRSWRSIHRNKIIASLRLRNYRDYVTGSDIGS